MSKLLIGWAEESIVPEKKVSLQGQFYERISNYVESEISVTAMAVEADGDQLVLVSADLVSITADLMKLFRQKLAELTDEIDPMELVYPKELPLFDKYDEYLPEELVKKGFACGVLDLEGLKKTLESWK